jgi:glycosyltransferase involved in cell wall biosynthesis
LLGREEFAVVVCHGSWPLAVFGVAAHLRGIPLVLWMHNNADPRNRSAGELLAARMRPDLVVCNSAFTASTLPVLFKTPPPHVVVACPVSSPSRAFARDEVRTALRRELSTPETDVVIILVGRPEAWKGHAVLLAALERLRTVPGWTAWLVGGAFDCTQEQFLATLQASAELKGIADRVRFPGQRTDVPELLASADLFCQPNLSPEPFGIVFIEALQAGLPVVATDHGGAQEIVDLSCGRLVPPGDDVALAATLEELIESSALRRQLSQQAPARAEAISGPAQLLPRIHSVLSGSHE